MLTNLGERRESEGDKEREEGERKREGGRREGEGHINTDSTNKLHVMLDDSPHSAMHPVTHNTFMN